MSTLEPTKGNMPAVLLEQDRAANERAILATLSRELQAEKIQAKFEGSGV
jgi:hypothetical protein